MTKNLLILLSVVLLAGCAANQPAPSAAPAAAPAPAVATSQRVAPTTTNARTASAETGANSSSTRREVKGIKDWSGYIVGTPAPKSKFSNLQIGMGMKEVMDVAGVPTDQRSHVTGKAFIPFYRGSGRHETKFYYKGVGRLVLAGDGGFSSGSALIGIEHDANERGYQ